MAQIFTSNQVNHVYVATALKTSNGKVAKSDAVGTISVQHDVEGNMYFMHRGQGGLVRSDLITNIMDIRYTPAPKMSRVQNALVVTVNSNALSGGNVFAGQDYLLRLEFQNPIGMSPEHKYWKYGIVHATSSMTASSFYAKMAKSLAINFSREAVKLVNIYLIKSNLSNTNTAGNLTLVDADKNQTLSDTYVGIKIVEASQDWILGVKQDKPIIFRVNNSTISDGTHDVYWADVLYTNGYKMVGGLEVSDTQAVWDSTDSRWEIDSSAVYLPQGDTIVNSHLAAELEYFAMGERADLYRGIGWPDNRITKYIVNPDNAYGYDMINIHYAYVGSNHAVQKSEKDITILVPRASTDNDTSDELKSIGALTASIKGYIDAIVNPEDSRYLTPSKLFTGDAYTAGHGAEIDKDSDGNISIVDAGS